MNTDKHAHEYCPRCKTTAFTFNDEHHAEIYCDHCGLIIRDNSINSITRTMQLRKYQERRIYKLHYKKMDNLTYKHLMG